MKSINLSTSRATRRQARPSSFTYEVAYETTRLQSRRLNAVMIELTDPTAKQPKPHLPRRNAQADVRPPLRHLVENAFARWQRVITT
jgi:hypothetical protein